MKKKRSKHSNKEKSIKNKKRRPTDDFFSNLQYSDDEFLQNLTEELSDKLGDVKDLLDVSELLSKSSVQKDSSLFNAEELLEKLHSTESVSSSKDETNPSQSKSKNADSKFGNDYHNSQNNSNSNDSNSSSTTSKGPSGYNYVGEPQTQYRFGFTNSEFLAFLASLNAIEYIIVLSLITILIMITLNKKEREVVYNFFITIGQTMGSGVDQTAFQEELQSQKEDSEKSTALQTDFDYLYNEMNALQKELNQLKEQLETSTTSS